MFERMQFPIWLIFIIFPFSKWRILFHHMKYPPNQRYRYVHFSFSPIWFCVNFHCFLVFQDGGSYGVIWNTPPSPHPESSHAFLQQFNFYHFVVFKDSEPYNVLWITPPPSNQRSGYVYLFFLPIDFASIFIVFSFSRMADIRRHMKYPWLESTLSTFWPLKYTPTPLSVFLIWFDVIRMPCKADSHAPHVWLAWLARLTRLPRMPRMVGSHASHASLARTLYKLVQFHQRGTKVPSTYCFTNRQHPLVIS